MPALRHISGKAASLLAVCALLAACGGDKLDEGGAAPPPTANSPAPSPGASPVPSATPSASPAPTPSASASPSPVPTPFSAAPLQARVLLSYQYANAVGDLLGPVARAAVKPADDAIINGSSSVGAASLAVSRAAVETFESNAFAAAQAAMADAAIKAKLITCKPASPTDDACLSTVLTSFGNRAFRRAITAEELTAWKNVAKSAATAYSSFDKGVEFAVAGMLQSPTFMYLAEQGVADAQRPGMVKYTGHEMAARMAFFLLGSTPPDSLLSAAAGGQLDTVAGVRAQAAALLDTPAARGALDRLFGEWLAFDEVTHVGKDSALYPGFNKTLAQAMRQESLLTINAIAADSKRNFLDIFDANFTYVNKALAAHYGYAAPATDDFIRIDLPAGSPRAGVLTQAAFLAAMAHPVETSPTLRGRLVRERLLCESVPAAPPDVITMLAPTPNSATTTLRQRLAVHVSEPRCAGCHNAMDPIGFGFEKFDSVGKFRTTEKNLPIDASGSLDSARKFNDAAELIKLLKADARLPSCVTRVVYRHAVGHVETAGEQPSLDAVARNAMVQGFSFRSLLVELVASDAFRYAKKI
jgi:hypothetical protein